MESPRRALWPALVALWASLALAPMRLSASPDGGDSAAQAVAADAAAGWSERAAERVPWTAVVAPEPELPDWRGSAEQRLALGVARVAANEGLMIRAADVALVWQVTRSRAETPRGRLSWLRGHSRRVLGDACDPEVHANCGWSQNLGWGRRRPQGWTDRYPAALWRPTGWIRVLRLALDLVEGRTHFEPCPRDPWSWGGRLDLAQAVAERGLIPLGCRGSLNDGFVPVSPPGG